METGDGLWLVDLWPFRPMAKPKESFHKDPRLGHKSASVIHRHFICKGIMNNLSYVMHFPSKLMRNSNEGDKLKVLGNLKDSPF
jgi:hypothetical protein